MLYDGNGEISSEKKSFPDQFCLCGVFKGIFWLINLDLIYRKVYRENWRQVFLTQRWIWLIKIHWRKMKVPCDGSAFVWLLNMFNSWLRPLGFKACSFRIQKFSLCFNKFFLVSLLKVLLRICLIIRKLASLLKICFFIAKWREARIVSDLYTSLWWLFSLKLKPISALPTYCLWRFLHFKR